uniref:Prostaglandin E synthase n=1 Tax=Spermophilus dauricus TaxID=99837 RepID=A0A8C9QHN6_SPEDA
LPSVLAMVSGQVFSAFMLCSTLLVIKMYVVAVITGQVRLPKKAFANPKDDLRQGDLQYFWSYSDVQFCLRTHWNDVETIYLFFFLGLVYTFLGPDPFLHLNVLLIFLLGLVLHTVAYPTHCGLLRILWEAASQHLTPPCPPDHGQELLWLSLGINIPSRFR